MTTTQSKTTVQGAEEKEGLFEKRTGRFLLFFKTEWWEMVSEKHIGNDIIVKTNRPIRAVIVNGQEYFSSIENK